MRAKRNSPKSYPSSAAAANVATSFAESDCVFDRIKGRVHAAARELLPGLLSGRSTIGRESGDRPFHAKRWASEGPTLLDLTRVFASVHSSKRPRPDDERARFWSARASNRRFGRLFGPCALGFSR